MCLENSWKHVMNSIIDVFLRSPPPPPRLSKEQKLARGVIVVNKAKQRKIRKASSSSSSKSTLDDSGQSKLNFWKYLFFVFFARNVIYWEEYFPNLPESKLLHQFLFIELETPDFGYLPIKLCKVLARLDQLDIYIYFLFAFLIQPKFKRGPF